MDKYIAIGKAQYHDSKDQVRHFKSKNDYQARHHKRFIIYQWD